MMEIVAIIPARAGSKGIPNKNIYPLCGKPLIGYTIEAAIKSKVAKYVFVSTDSEKIADVAIRFGAEVIERPKEISHDTASTEAVLIHALEAIERKWNWMPDHVLTLPPTSPLRSSRTIQGFVLFYQEISNRYDAALSLTETRDDYWMRNGKGEFQRLFPDAPRRRQEREPLYVENSAIYMTRRTTLLKTGSILGSSVAGYVIEESEAVDINEPEDILYCEFLLKNSGEMYLRKSE